MGLLTEIRGLLAITCLSGDEPEIEEQIISKITEVVEGAGLTDEEIRIALSIYKEWDGKSCCINKAKLGNVANAQTNAILKAIKGE